MFGDDCAVRKGGGRVLAVVVLIVVLAVKIMAGSTGVDDGRY